MIADVPFRGREMSKGRKQVVKKWVEIQSEKETKVALGHWEGGRWQNYIVEGGENDVIGMTMQKVVKYTSTEKPYNLYLFRL